MESIAPSVIAPPTPTRLPSHRTPYTVYHPDNSSPLNQRNDRMTGEREWKGFPFSVQRYPVAAITIGPGRPGRTSKVRTENKHR